MKEEIQKSLEKIGWSIKGLHPNKRIFTHEGKGTDIRVMGDRLEISGDSFDCSFYYKGIELYELRDEGKEVDCIGVKAKGNNDVFIQFYNHSK